MFAFTISPTDRMLLGLTDALPALVEAKYKAAKAAASLIFSPTELAVIRTTSGVPVSKYMSSQRPKAQGFARAVLTSKYSSNYATVQRLRRSQHQRKTSPKLPARSLIRSTTLPSSF